MVKRISLTVLLIFSALVFSAARSAPPPPDWSHRPSAQAGAAVFAENCTRCHGPAGRGDGPLRAQVIENNKTPPPNFTDPGFSDQGQPTAWFTTITEGRLDKLMPPWGASLTEQQRLDALYYLISLSAPADEVVAGQLAYSTSCAQCHGVTGTGDGPQAKGTLPNLSKPETLFATSQNDLIVALKAHKDVPTLNDGQWHDIATYVRTLGYDYAPPAVLATVVVTITGDLQNGTLDGAVPDGLPLTLYAFDHTALQGGTSPMPARTYTQTVSAGRFAFAGVRVPPQGVLMATVRYQDVLYTGFTVVETLTGTNTVSTTTTLPIQVYDSTLDEQNLTIEQMHFVFEGRRGVTTVTQFFDINIKGDLAFAGTLDFPLPANALDVQFPADNTVTLERTATGFGGKIPLTPGQAESLSVTYRLPVAGETSAQWIMPYTVNNVLVFVADDGAVTVSGGALAPIESTNLPKGFLAYTAGADYTPGQAFTLTLKGADDNRGVALASGALALVIAVACVVVLYQRRTQSAPGAARAALVAELAALDDAHADGRVAEREYRKRRGVLLNRLLTVWAGEGEPA